jgi:hypothetical protein
MWNKPFIKEWDILDIAYCLYTTTLVFCAYFYGDNCCCPLWPKHVVYINNIMQNIRVKMCHDWPTYNKVLIFTLPHQPYIHVTTPDLCLCSYRTLTSMCPHQPHVPFYRSVSNLCSLTGLYSCCHIILLTMLLHQPYVNVTAGVFFLKHLNSSYIYIYIYKQVKGSYLDIRNGIWFISNV